MRTAYHEQLESLTNRLGEMCGLAGVAMERATQALLQADLVLALCVAGELALFASAVWLGPTRSGWPLGVGVFVCHAIAYLVDVKKGTADASRHLSSLLYLVQLPVFPAGPLSRHHEFADQAVKADVSMAGFSYGVRRIVTGLTKVYLVAGPLGAVALIS